MMKTKFQYIVYDNNTVSVSFQYVGTRLGAKRQAVRHAKKAFPSWINGHGPSIIVVNLDGLETYGMRL